MAADLVNSMEDAWKEVWQEVGLPSLDEIVKQNAESYKALSNFAASIEWTEPLLIGLGVFYLISIIAIIVTRKNFTSQFAIWASFLAMVFISEPLNEFCMNNWQKLVSRPYFTKSGAFISAVYSAPLLILSLIITINFVFLTAGMLIDVKRKQFAQERKRKEAQQQGKDKTAKMPSKETKKEK